MMASRRAVTADRRLPVTAAMPAVAAMAATVEWWWSRKWTAASVVMPSVRTERAALAAVLLAATAATAALAAPADRLMEASPKVAMAATDLRSVLVMTSTLLTYAIAAQRQE